MENKIQTTLRTILQGAVRHPDTVKTVAWGREHVFERYDVFDDTFILEEGILDNLQNKDSVVLVPKSVLQSASEPDSARVFGHVMTLSTGNHAATSIPLVSGKFWGLSNLSEAEQAEALQHRIVCANHVGGTLELSQRAVSTADLAETDDWLGELGFPMQKVVLIDRVDETIEFYARRGQEWRIKPLVWTVEEMENVLRFSASHIHSPIRYYHNVRGVHFLTYRNFRAWGELIQTDFPKFMLGLSELCGTDEDQPVCNLLLPKYQAHHEIELFGMPAGVAEKSLYPILFEMWDILSKADPDNPETRSDAKSRFEAAAMSFRTLLADPVYMNESAPKFLETIYRYLNGAIYHDEHDSMSRAFDDLRTALPGATYALGNRFVHEGVDARTIAILNSLESSLSQGDCIEYVNVYEIRSATDRVRLGEGKTREIVYKTIWSPLPSRLVEKRLARRATGYGAYTLARIQAFRALGVSYGKHRLLARSDGSLGDVHYFTRARYPGQPFTQLPASSFFDRDPRTGVYNTEHESRDIVRALLVLMGQAAAENMTLKKRTPDGSPRFAEGKEIIEFGYDVRWGKEMPRRVRLCSIRGTLGWPDLSRTEENIAAIFDFYLTRYAQVVHEYAEAHTVLYGEVLLDAFWEGFSARIRELAWNYVTRRELFDGFQPRIFGDFRFSEKWSFALWSLEESRNRLDEMNRIFIEKFNALGKVGQAEESPTQA